MLTTFGELHEAVWPPQESPSRRQTVAAPGGQRPGHVNAGEGCPPALTRRPHREIPGEPGDQRRQRERPERQVDVEDPPPARMVGDPAAAERTDDAREPPHSREQPLPPGALGRGEDVADEDEDQRHERPGSQPLQPPERDELVHGLGGARERGANQEHRHRGEHDPPPPELVRELADKGNHGG